MNERCENCPSNIRAQVNFNAQAHIYRTVCGTVGDIGLESPEFDWFYNYDMAVLRRNEMDFYESVDNCTGPSKTRLGELSCNNSVAINKGSIAEERRIKLLAADFQQILTDIISSANSTR